MVRSWDSWTSFGWISPVFHDAVRFMKIRMAEAPSTWAECLCLLDLNVVEPALTL